MSRSHWKIQRDPFYRDLETLLGGQDGLEHAGFFWDTATQDEPLDDIRWLCTPLTHVRHHMMSAPSRPIILLSTGAFCPPHMGHLSMMETAKRAAEDAGFAVVGGFLSPGHDEYITLKCKEESIPASQRLEMCARATAVSDWLTVDPWEALYRNCAVNFTDVIARLEAYVAHHIGRAIPIAYVCGGDNARFALTFARRGHCIVVARPGHEHAVEATRRHTLMAANPRILWATHDDASSSTDVRRGARHLMPPNLRALRPLTSALMIRREAPELCSTLCPESIDWFAFVEDLQDILSSYFSTVSVIDHHAQALRLKEYINAAPEHPVISLDPMLPTANNLAISRLFDLGGYTQRGYTPRPSHPPLTQQLKALPLGDVRLFDDDQATGNTLTYAKACLAPRRVLSTYTATPTRPDTSDIVDARDFFPGTQDGGLVITLPDGQRARAPYLMPYADPHARFGVPGADSMACSIELWALIAKHTQDTQLCVRDLPTASQRLWDAQGHAPDTRLHQICRAHLRRLQHDKNVATY